MMFIRMKHNVTVPYYPEFVFDRGYALDNDELAKQLIKDGHAVEELPGAPVKVEPEVEALVDSPKLKKS